MYIVIETVYLVTGYNFCVQSVNSHIHNTELCVILHLFLTEKSHSGVGICAVLFNKISRRNEHAARTAGRIYKDAIFDTNRKSLLRHISAEKGLK